MKVSAALVQIFKYCALKVLLHPYRRYKLNYHKSVWISNRDTDKKDFGKREKKVIPNIKTMA